MPGFNGSRSAILDMGNTLSSGRSQKGKTLDVELFDSSTGPTLPICEPRPTDTRPVSHSDSLDCPDFLKDGFETEFSNFKRELKLKVKEYGDAIQPHTDEGGEAYYIGDAYEAVKAKWADEWRIPK